MLVPFGQLVRLGTACATGSCLDRSEAQLLVVAMVAEPFVDHAPLVIEIAGKICPWTCLPHAVLVEESHLSSSFPWMIYVHLFSFLDPFLFR